MATLAMRPRYTTPTNQVFAVSSSEAASLKGKPALTPIIAGSVCGFFLALAWTVGLISYLVRRRKKKARAKKVAAGLKPPKPEVQPPEKYISPPDPAVVLGMRQPGEHVIVEPKRRHGMLHLKHAKTMPVTSGVDGGTAEGSTSGGSSLTPHQIVHSNTDPSSSHLDHDATHSLTNGNKN